MVESVRRVTGYHVVQFSDLSTPVVDGVDEIIRMPMKMPLMPFRLAHLAKCPYEQWVSFDTDVIVKKPFSDVWERPFDVALTRRPKGRCLDPEGRDIAPFMPFNTGVMLSREPDFWVEALKWLKDEPTWWDWWGDQMAVSAIAHRYHVLTLPASEFNWTPAKRDEASAARIIHFKGNRKGWMTGEPDQTH